jgi:mycothiol system anti-sigma-R factor
MGEELGCRETLREIARYVDGECLHELTVQVEEHLSGCEDCHGHAEFQRHVKEIVAKKCGGDALPESVVVRIREGIRSSRT